MVHEILNSPKLCHQYLHRNQLQLELVSDLKRWFNGFELCILLFNALHKLCQQVCLCCAIFGWSASGRGGCLIRGWLVAWWGLLGCCSSCSFSWLPHILGVANWWPVTHFATMVAYVMLMSTLHFVVVLWATAKTFSLHKFEIGGVAFCLLWLIWVILMCGIYFHSIRVFSWCPLGRIGKNLAFLLSLTLANALIKHLCSMLEVVKFGNRTIRNG